MSWYRVTHHTLKTLLHIVQVLVFVVLPGILLWLHFAGLPKALHKPLVEAAEREGLELQFDRMRLSFLQGLVLDKVRLRAAQLPDNPDVAVDRAAISLDWRRLLQGQVVLHALDLRGAQLYLPVAAQDGVVRTIRLTKARARLMLADGVVSIPLARFNLQGIDVTASGQVLLATEGTTPSGALLPPEAARAVEIIESLDFGSEAPRLDLDFSAHSGDASSLQLPRLHLEAPYLAYGGIRLRDVRLDGAFAAGVLEVQRLVARDERGGAIDASGRWDPARGEARADWSSSLDPAPWLAEFQPDAAWNELLLESPPEVQGTLQVTPGEPRQVQILGTLSCRTFAFRGVKFRSLVGGFAWRNGELYASDVVLGLPTGELRADLMLRPGNVRLRVDGQADPSPLAAFLGERDREGLTKLNLRFIDPPLIRLEASGERLDPVALKAQGTVQLGRASIHESPFDQATADVIYEDRALTFANIKIQRPEGSGTGAFTIDFGRDQVRLDGIRSAMNPYDVLRWASPGVAQAVVPYRFKAPPDVTVGGVVGLRDPAATRLWADFNAAQGLDYDLLDRTLVFGATAGSLEVTGRKIKVNIPSARIYGGRVRLAAEITAGQAGATQKVTVDLDSVNFETLTRLYFGYKDSQGVVSGRYDFTFVPGQPAQMRGSGRLTVEDGNVFAIPVLGPLSTILDGIIPGAGFQTARQATCDFRVADGEIRTENLDIIGRGFSIIGEGTLFFLRDRMNFSVRVNAQGVPGVLLYPVSKLFEYVSDGKLSEPLWRPKALPKGIVPGSPREPRGGGANGN